MSAFRPVHPERCADTRESIIRWCSVIRSDERIAVHHGVSVEYVAKIRAVPRPLSNDQLPSHRAGGDEGDGIHEYPAFCKATREASERLAAALRRVAA